MGRAITVRDMISVEEARERILSHFSRLEPETKPITDGLGQVLAQDVRSDFDIPPLDNTAMDGYAVIAADTDGASEASPVRLRVAGDLAAGYIYEGTVTPGTAVRIMTGASIPGGADSIVPFEETDEALDGPKLETEVAVLKAVQPGANVRKAGEDVRKGETVLPKDAVLHAAQIGLLASVGKAEVSVYRRPVVAILSTGDELLDVGEPVMPGKIYDSNAYSVSSMVVEAGGIPQRLGIAADTVDALTVKLREGLEADMLVTSAGVSRGDFDVVKDVLAKEGKPLACGAFSTENGHVPHIGLPGNPVSSMVTFELFGRPAIYKMLGKAGWQRPRVTAVAKERIVNEDGRRVYARAILTRNGDGDHEASLTGPQGSGILTSMALANALAIVPEDALAIEPGQQVECLLLE